jgi:uncharacterized 2Fe-2S/4Fe-4S cluster protein (DUF4445 family)
MKEKINITLVKADGGEYEFWTLTGKRLWDSLADSGISIGGSCGGNGLCGKCKLRVEGAVGEISDKERDQLLPEEIRQGFRLACYCRVFAPLKVYIDYTEQEQEGRDIYPYSGFSPPGPPLLECKQFFIPGIDKEKPLSLHRRLITALPGYELELSMENLSALARLDRSGRPSLELKALVYPDEAVKYIGPKTFRAFGIALDIGTTTIFAALLDLQKLETAAVISRSNLQKTFGGDIISRLSYVLDSDDGLQILHQVLLNSINGCIDEMLAETGLQAQDIYAFSVAGNPVMMHFFAGLNPAGYAATPYVGVFTDEIRCSARQLGLHASREAECYLLPQIGGFVGADTVAALLTISPDSNQTYLLVDIGTNGEVVLVHQGQMWAASAAAGPAFEGGGISCGMRAGDGAIDRVYFIKDGEMEFNVLGHGLPRGLCGSAVIDLLACFLHMGMIDSNGIIAFSEAQLNKATADLEGGKIVLLEDSRTAHGLEIFVSQEDIRQVQLAKSAVRSAIDTLLSEAGIEARQIDTVYLAGSFGNHINPASALRIGLLPQVSLAAVKNAGNAAGQGVIQVLFSKSARERAQAIAHKVRHIEIASQPGFQELFLSQLNFPTVE